MVSLVVGDDALTTISTCAWAYSCGWLKPSSEARSRSSIEPFALMRRGACSWTSCLPWRIVRPPLPAAELLIWLAFLSPVNLGPKRPSAGFASLKMQYWARSSRFHATGSTCERAAKPGDRSLETHASKGDAVSRPRASLPAVDACPGVHDLLATVDHKITVIGRGRCAGMIGQDPDARADRQAFEIDFARSAGDHAMFLIGG